jgi:hypothetical protein
VPTPSAVDALRALPVQAVAALEQMGWVRVNEAWAKEVTVGGEPHTSYIPGPATKALTFVMRAKTDRHPG